MGKQDGKEEHRPICVVGQLHIELDIKEIQDLSMVSGLIRMPFTKEETKNIRTLPIK